MRNIAIDPQYTHASHQLLDIVRDDTLNETFLYCSTLNRFGAAPKTPDISDFMQVAGKKEVMTDVDKQEAKSMLSHIVGDLKASAKSGYRLNRDEHSLIYTLCYDQKRQPVSFDLGAGLVCMTDKVSFQDILDGRIDDPVILKKIALWRGLFKGQGENLHQELHAMQHDIMCGLFQWTQDNSVSCIGMAVKKGQTKENRIPSTYFNTLDVLEGRMPKQMDGYDYYVPGTNSLERAHLINMAVMTGFLDNKEIFSRDFISAVAVGLTEGYLKKGQTLV